jgi:nitronate monooxygenase
MYLVTTPALVIAACEGGIAAVIPALNAEDARQLDGWLGEIAAAVHHECAGSWGVNLVCHSSNARLADDLAVVEAHRAPLVVTSVGSPEAVVARIRAYGGTVWSDVINTRQARKAADAGVDGLVLVSAGAGGNTGWFSPFAFLKEVRGFFDGVVAIAGGITDGQQVRALNGLGADFGYVGTPFIATAESAASDDYKRAVVDGHAGDIVLSRAISGIPANLLRASLEQLNIDADHTPALNVGGWRRSEAWSAGHGIASVTGIERCSQLVDRLVAEYRNACSRAISAP